MFHPHGDGRGRGPNLIAAVLHACDVLEAFKAETELLRISDVADRTGLSRPTTLRLLYTLEQRGLVERVGRYQYRRGVRPLQRPLYRLGYGSHSTEFAFSRDVGDSIALAAKEEQMDLLRLDNRYSPRVAVRNAEAFIRERVDLVIEFQADEHVAAPIISAKLMDANIPLIAVEIPHPGATYYGANNYVAGLIGGRYLGKWAKSHWNGRVDEILLLELQMSGPVPASRLTGILMGIREELPQMDDSAVVRLNGNGRFEASLESVRKHLRQRRAQRILVGAMNDPSAIGALRAFEEVGRSDNCAVMGQNASAEARVELRRPGSRLIGSVGYFPESYGSGVVTLALDILRGSRVPPAVFTKHKLITPENVDHFYPNDTLLMANELDTSLMRSC
jgi:ribose transport system substrate-binding protein